MKPVGLISTGVLLLLLGIVARTYAYQEQQEQEAKPPKQEQQAKPEKKQQAKGQQQQQQQDKAAKQQQQQQDKGQQQQKQQAKGQQQQQRVQQQQQDQNRQQQQRQQQAKGQQEQQRQRVQQSEQRGVWQQHRARSWQSEHRDWQQRGGYNGYRIPDDRYRGNFGPDHAFRIYSYPVEVFGGYPRFQYGGFWFGLIDPWPEYWSDDWYENDDVYIDYSGDGYYMYNRRYPRDRIAVTVYLN